MPRAKLVDLPLQIADQEPRWPQRRSSVHYPPRAPNRRTRPRPQPCARRTYRGIRVAALALGRPRAREDADDVRFRARAARSPKCPAGRGIVRKPSLQGLCRRPTSPAGGQRGYQCNLELVGQYLSPARARFDPFEDCAYYGLGAYAGGTQVLDVTDRRAPVPSAAARPAMLDPWESLRVNLKRKLLVADSNTPPTWTSMTCRRAAAAAAAVEHRHGAGAGPRGMVLAGRDDVLHELDRVDGTRRSSRSTSRPGAPEAEPPGRSSRRRTAARPPRTATRSYICQQQARLPQDELLLVDTSQGRRARAGRAAAHARAGAAAGQPVVSGRLPGHLRRSPVPDPVRRALGCGRLRARRRQLGVVRLSADLRSGRRDQPQLVSTALLESALPEHCEEVTGEGAINGLGYSVHHCSPDRLYDPTILACGWFFAGVRVLDIRDPTRPVEIGYFNPGVGAIVGTGARPVVRAERGEIWFVNERAASTSCDSPTAPGRSSPRRAARSSTTTTTRTTTRTQPARRRTSTGSANPRPGARRRSARRPRCRCAFAAARPASAAPLPGWPAGSSPPSGIAAKEACRGRLKLTVTGRRTQRIKLGRSCRVTRIVTVRRSRTGSDFIALRRQRERRRGQPAGASRARRLLARLRGIPVDPARRPPIRSSRMRASASKPVSGGATQGPGAQRRSDRRPPEPRPGAPALARQPRRRAGASSPGAPSSPRPSGQEGLAGDVPCEPRRWTSSKRSSATRSSSGPAISPRSTPSATRATSSSRRCRSSRGIEHAARQGRHRGAEAQLQHL